MKTIFVIQGYESIESDGTVKDVVTIEVYAKNEKKAIEKAKSYCKKTNYRVSQIIEK